MNLTVDDIDVKLTKNLELHESFGEGNKNQYLR